MPATSTSTDLATIQQPAAPRKKNDRRKLRSVGVIAVAAALLGSVALPAVALQPQSGGQNSYLSMTSEPQTISIETSAGTQEISLPAVDATTPEELAEIQEAAAQAAELAAQQEAEAAAAAGTTSSTSSSGSGATSAAAPASNVAVSAASGDVVSIAVSKLGSAYVFGATGPYAFDCSGFTSWVFAQVGVSLPRIASSQASVGTPVSSVAPGDLLVWPGREHVAIYVGGDTVIHAATPSSGVKYSSYSALVNAWGAPQIRRF